MDNPLRRAASRVPMDEIVSNIVGLGVPGLVLLLAVDATGMAGAAAVSAALVALGPGGMIGGAVSLVFAGLVARSIAEHGFEALYKEVVEDLMAQGETKESLLAKIDGYPLSAGLKATMREYLAELPDRMSIEIDATVEKVEEEQ